MKIYELDTDDRLSELRQKLKYATIIKDSLASDREQYRKFADSITMDYNALFSCCDSLEKEVLIGIYTYAEQLFKNFYYELVEKDKCKNIYIKNYFNKRLNERDFSPNVTYDVIESNIRKELIPSFKFFVNSNRDEIKKYDELISTRHTYAHRGVYMYSIDDFPDVIAVEEYLTEEVSIIVKRREKERLYLIKCLKELKSKATQCQGMRKEYTTSRNVEVKKKIRIILKDIKNNAVLINKSHSCSLLECKLLKELNIAIQDWRNIDLRKFDEACNYVDKFEQLLEGFNLK